MRRIKGLVVATHEPTGARAEVLVRLHKSVRAAKEHATRLCMSRARLMNREDKVDRLYYDDLPHYPDQEEERRRLIESRRRLAE